MYMLQHFGIVSPISDTITDLKHLYIQEMTKNSVKYPENWELALFSNLLKCDDVIKVHHATPWFLTYLGYFPLDIGRTSNVHKISKDIQDVFGG